MSLGIDEINSLIELYHSELKKLDFQVAKVRETIKELQDSRLHIKAAATTRPPLGKKLLPERVKKEKQRKRGRPKKDPNAPPQQDVPRKSTFDIMSVPIEVQNLVAELESGGDGYKLSSWDIALINALYSSKKLLTNNALLDVFELKNRLENHELDEERLRGKLSRSLHKMANKRDIITKEYYPSRGHYYGLYIWLDDSGNMPENYFPTEAG